MWLTVSVKSIFFCRTICSSQIVVVDSYNLADSFLLNLFSFGEPFVDFKL